MERSMWNRALIAAAAVAGIAVAGAASATSDATGVKTDEQALEQARIPFAATSGIRSWQAVDRDTILVEGRRNKWYRAELMGACPGVTHAWAIAFDYEPDGSLDRFSSIIVDGQRCAFRSLTETENPREEVQAKLQE